MKHTEGLTMDEVMSLGLKILNKITSTLFVGYDNENVQYVYQSFDKGNTFVTVSNNFNNDKFFMRKSRTTHKKVQAKRRRAGN